MMECRAIAIVAKLVPLFLQRRSPNALNQTSPTKIRIVQPWTTRLFHSSNYPTLTCMGTHVSLKKLITKVKVSTLLQNIHRSKLENIIVVDAKFDRTCWSMVFFTMASNISSTKENQDGEIKMEKPHGGTGV